MCIIIQVVPGLFLKCPALCDSSAEELTPQNNIEASKQLASSSEARTNGTVKQFICVEEVFSNWFLFEWDLSLNQHACFQT